MSTLLDRSVRWNGRGMSSPTGSPRLRLFNRRRRVQFLLRRRTLRPIIEVLENLTLLSTQVLPGSILGTLYDDRSRDGVRQPGEPGLAGAMVYLDLNHDQKLDTTAVQVPGSSTDIGPAPSQLGAFGFEAATVPVQGFPVTIAKLTVSMDLTNNGSNPVAVSVFSPTGADVPDLPTLFVIEPGEHFVGTFDDQAATPITDAPNPLPPGTYRPQQILNMPTAHVYDGDPNGTWGVAFVSASPDSADISGLDLKSWSLNFSLAEPSTSTRADGSYSFTSLAPGAYQVVAPLAPGASATNPSGSVPTQTVAVGPGQSVEGVDFGAQAASDLTGTAFDLVSPATAWGQDVTIHYTLANRGLGDAPGFDVDLRLSPSAVITTAGTRLGTFHVNGLAAGASTSGTVTVRLPADPPSGFGGLSDSVVGLVIDPAHNLARNDASGGSNRGLGVDAAVLAARPNQALAPSNAAEQEPSIAVDPTDSKHLVVAYLDFSQHTSQAGYAGVGVSVSTDGGDHWKPSAIALPAGYDGAADAPTVKFDAQGNVYVVFTAATFLGAQPGLAHPITSENPDGFTANNGVFVAVSTQAQRGLAWAPPVAVDANDYAHNDRTPVPFDLVPDFAIDTFQTLPGGRTNPDFGNLYVTWTRLYPAGQLPGHPDATGGSDIMFAVSTDGGRTWTTRLQTDPTTGAAVSTIQDPLLGGQGDVSPGQGFLFYSQVAIGPEGDLYVSTYAGGYFTVYHSTDEGASFRPPNYYKDLGLPFFPTTPVPSPTLMGDTFRTHAVRDIVADPAHPGRVFVADAAAVASALTGAPIDAGEAVFAYSDDYGQTWLPYFQVGSEPTNLDQLPPGENDSFLSALNDDNGGRYLAFDTPDSLKAEVISGQAYPSLAIDAQGHLTAIWYDTRRDPSGQGLDVFGTTSTDGGRTFSANFRVTDATFDPNSHAFTDAEGNVDNFLGDHIGVAAADGFGYAVWTDTRSGTQQIEFQRYAMAPAPAPSIDRYSPNFTAATATDLGQVTATRTVPNLELGPEGDEWFRIQASATGTLIVSATPSVADTSVALELTDASGHPLPATVTDLRDATGAIVGTQVVSPSVSGQSYLVHLHSHGDGVAYSLTVGSLTADLGEAVQAARAGPLEAGGRAVYRLQAGVSGSLSVALDSGGDVQGGLVVTVLGPDGQTVLAAGPRGGTPAGQSQQVSVPVARGQVVLVEVAGADDSSQGRYSLRLTNLDQYETPGETSLFVPTGNNPSAIAVGDLTGKGIAGIVVSNTDTNDSASVLLSNGDGTFQSPRQYVIGPGLSGGLLDSGYREIGLAKFDGDQVPDLVVPNYRSGDVSVLVGNGDGTFQPQRRFGGTPSPDSTTTGDFTGRGHTDVAVLQDFPVAGGTSKFAVLLGRGDGTFAPPVEYSTIFSAGAFPIRAGDFTGDHKSDLVVFSSNSPRGQIFLNTGDGTFRDGGTFSTGENVENAQVADLNGDGRLDLVTTGTSSGNVFVLLGNGDGTFQTPRAFRAMSPRPGDNISIDGLAIADFGGTANPGASGAGPGAPDGLPDLLVTAQSRSGVGPAEVIMLPGLKDEAGQFAGFGAPVVLATVAKAGQVATGDFTGDGAADLAVTQPGGVLVIYGTPAASGGVAGEPAVPLQLAPNDTPATARDLGSATHVVTLPQAIVAGHEDAYDRFTVPTEAYTDSGDQVVDFSALFQDVQGAGLQMEVRDASGTLLGSGARFRVVAAQGATLTVRVFGQTSADGTRGAGAYTLDIDVLPQVVAVEAESVLPGGPATSLVVTLQGDRLNRATAQDPANYTVTWLGPDDLAGTADDRVIPVAALGGGQPVVYSPSSNVDVASGLAYPTAVRHTITLLFAQPLPPGSYEVKLSAQIQADPASGDEAGMLAGDASFAGHPIVSSRGEIIQNGSSFVVPGLVSASGTPGDPRSIAKGTAFLTQLQGDLSSLLDVLLAARGDDPSLTDTLNNQILARFAPALAAAGNGSQTLTFSIIWFDPVSIDLQSPQGGISYSASSNVASNSLGQTFVSVGGNVEVIVMANMSGTFNLDVGNVSDSARGGAVLLSSNSSQLFSFTDALRGGESGFELNAGDLVGGTTPGNGDGSGNGNGGGGTPFGPSPAPGETSVASAGTPGVSPAGALSQATTSLLATVLIGGPLGATDSSSSSGVGGGPAAPAAANPPGGPPGASAGNELVRSRSQGRSNVGNRALRDEVDDTTMARWAGYIKSTLQFVKSKLSRTWIVKAMGMRQQSPVVLLWQGLLQALGRLKAQAAAAAAHAGQPAPAPGDAGAHAPAADRAPGPEKNNADMTGLPLWDQGVERLLDRPDAVEELAADNPSGTYVYWASLIAAVQVGQASRHARVRRRLAAATSRRLARS